jgi:hypothetical protein
MSESIPAVGEADLADYAATALAEATMMHQAARENARSVDEVIGILTASMVECFERGRNLQRSYDPRLLAQDRTLIAGDLLVCLKTICAASLALVPIYDVALKMVQRELRGQN